ncbi:MAG: PAS domain S-box protein [Desulfobacterales bacterium]|nr:PAS domain S-box protein [Desulfobacterales bacterium]
MLVNEKYMKGRLEAARRTIKFFETLLRASTDGIVITDTTQNIVVVNDAFCALIGARWGDVVETSLLGWLERIGGAPPRRWAELEKRVRREGAHREAEFTLTTGGENRWFDVNASLLERVADEEWGGIVSIWRDVTQRKRTEIALEKARDEIIRVEKLATIGRLSGGIAHEIRNPLAVIDSSIFYLKSILNENGGKTVTHLDRIKSQVDRMASVIESMTSITRMKEPKWEKIDLLAVASDAISAAAAPDDVHVTMISPEEKILIEADREQINMAFANIITNAAQAMEGKGHLDIKIRGASDDRVEASFTDTGPGVDQENLEIIFQPLFSTRAKGMGFGLSIVKMVVDKHGGTVEARTDAGKGATIIVGLPVSAKGSRRK